MAKSNNRDSASEYVAAYCLENLPDSIEERTRLLLAIMNVLPLGHEMQSHAALLRQQLLTHSELAAKAKPELKFKP